MYHFIESYSFVSGCSLQLPDTSKGIYLFNIFFSYLETEGFSWKDIVGICSDCAPSMVGSIKEFASLVEQENPVIISTHCFLYRQVLISKSLWEEQGNVFDDVTIMAYFIKQKPVYFRMFKWLFENLDKEHLNVLLCTEIWWLNRGRILNIVF